jgi:formylglycine-generating enzyme required for sulfatase activity
LGTHEVTVGQFRRFVQAQSYLTEAEKDGEGGYGWNDDEGDFEGRKPMYNWRNTGWLQTDEHPAVSVTWNDAVAFCRWLSQKERIAT